MSHRPHHLSATLALGLLAAAVQGAFAAPPLAPADDNAASAEAASPEVEAAIAATLAMNPRPTGSGSPIVVEGTGLGPIPDGPGPSCGVVGPPLDIAFNVPVVGGELVDVDVDIGFSPNHTWAGDITAVLIAPGGSREHTLFGRLGATTATGCGDNSDLAGPYTFSDFASPPSGGIWEAAVAAGSASPVASGSYFTTDSGGAGAVTPMPATSIGAAFVGMSPAQAQGTWILRITDGGQQDTGAVSLATLRVYYGTGELPIYDNGPLSTGAVSDSGVVAPGSYQWSEAQVDDDAPGVANTLAGVSGSVTTDFEFRLADDFTVPAGQSWTLSKAEFAAYQTGYAGVPAPFDRLTLRIWDGPPGEPTSTLLCGDEVTNVYQGATEMGLLRIFNSLVPPPGNTPTNTRRIWALRASIPVGCSGEDYFSPGTYWLDWNSRLPGLGPHFVPPVTVPGARNRPGDNARQRNSSGTWVAVLDEGNPITPPSLPQDLPFKLFGMINDGDTIFANGFEQPM